MQTTLLWSGIEYHSLEHCIVEVSKVAINVQATVVGVYEQQMYKLDYKIDLDGAWKIHSCYIEFYLNNKKETIELIKKVQGWFLNGNYHPEFDACFYVDIPLTPFTNSLPINQMNLKTHEEIVIEVLYLDLLKKEIKPVKQKYKRMTKNSYHYENVPNDFEALIEVDEKGFVVDYPQLFTRTAIQN